MATVTDKLEEKVTSQAGLSASDATLPPDTKVVGSPLAEKSNEIISQQNLGTAPTTTTTAATTANLNVATPPTPNVQTYTAYTTPNTTQAAAAQGTLNSQAIIGNIQGAVSNASLANAAQGTVSQEATVKYQLGELFKAIGTGTNLPGWASPAVTKVSAIMAQRGLGASSMASAAMTQAIMESAISEIRILAISGVNSGNVVHPLPLVPSNGAKAVRICIRPGSSASV